MRLAILGILAGVPAALALTRVMVSMILGIRSWDPAVFAAATVLLSAVRYLRPIALAPRE